MAAFFSIICICLGLFLLYNGVMSYYKMKKLEAKGVITKAIIIEVIIKEDNDPEFGRSISYWPIYEYTDMYGMVHRQKPTSTTSMEVYRIGDIVDIAYYPNSDDEILILSKIGKWKDVVMFILIGAIYFFIGLAFFI